MKLRASTFTALLVSAATALAAPTLIEFQGDAVSINGAALSTKKKKPAGPHVTLSLKAAEAALGPSDRTNNVSEEKYFYLWDALGLQMAEWQENIFSLTIQFSHEHFVPEETMKPSDRETSLALHKLNQLSDPKSDYTGTVAINGLAIKPGTRLSDIQSALQKQGFTFDLAHREATLAHATYEILVRWQPDDSTIDACAFKLTK